MSEIKRRKVALRRCDDYDVGKITPIIREMTSDLGLSICGKVFIKPNIVSANRGYIHNSFTHPAVIESLIAVLRESSPQEIKIGESGGYGIPSRLFFYESGHSALAKKLRVPLIDLNEDRLIRVPLAKGVWHKEILLAESIRKADFKVWAPKLKYHIFAQITNALKLNIGILTHKERMLYHDYRIHEKIVDLLEAGFPDLVITDAIDITYGFESAPYPVRLGALMASNDPLAADVVAAHILGYNPKDVKHLAAACERGYGSLELSDVEVTGDVTIDELASKQKGRRTLFQSLSELETPIKFYGGEAFDTGIKCDGGCEGALKGCLGTIEKRRPGSLAKARKGAIVTGVYKGDVVSPDGPVLLIGDCARVDGKIEAPQVVKSSGCPTPARNLFVNVPRLYKMPSPMLDARDAALFVYFAAVSAFFKSVRKIRNFFDLFMPKN